MLVKAFTYTGTGSAHSRTGIGFNPDLVIIKGGNNHAVFATTTMDAGDAGYFANAAANLTDAITSLDNDGFSVGASVTTNALGTPYVGVAVKNNGDGDFAVGTYTGTGSAHAVTSEMAADFVFTKRDGNSVGCWRSSAMPPTESSHFSATANITTGITALGATTFDVDTSNTANASGSDYHWFGFKSVANEFGVGTYAGDGADNRDITLNAQPVFVGVKGEGTQIGVLRTVDIAGDDTLTFGTTAGGSNRIQQITATGIQIGSNSVVNQSGVDYYHFWMLNVLNATQWIVWSDG